MRVLLKRAVNLIIQSVQCPSHCVYHAIPQIGTCRAGRFPGGRGAGGLWLPKLVT